MTLNIFHTRDWQPRSTIGQSKWSTRIRFLSLNTVGSTNRIVKFSNLLRKSSQALIHMQLYCPVTMDNKNVSSHSVTER